MGQGSAFDPKRVFFVYRVQNWRVRGEHAHKECHQFLICVHGSMAVVVDNGKTREEFALDQPWIGLDISLWSGEFNTSARAIVVLAVFASHPYDPDDYIREYDQFLRYLENR